MTSDINKAYIPNFKYDNKHIKRSFITLAIMVILKVIFTFPTACKKAAKIASK